VGLRAFLLGVTVGVRESLLDREEVQRGDSDASLFQTPADYTMTVQPPVVAAQ
jgi:hypothetical protein